jgi:hypothetical protein
MEEWQAKLAHWEQRLAEWNRSFEERYARLARDRKRWLRPLSAAEKEEIAAAARKLTGEELAVELFAFLSALCDAYVAAPMPQDRAKTRAWVGAGPNLLNAVWNYATQAPELIRGPHDAPMLTRGLAAISLDDVRSDYQDVLEALARLWIAARKAGLDPKPEFERVARASNPGMGGGGAFMQRTLLEFESSSYFRDHVRPRLPRASA